MPATGIVDKWMDEVCSRLDGTEAGNILARFRDRSEAVAVLVSVAETGVTLVVNVRLGRTVAADVALSAVGCGEGAADCAGCIDQLPINKPMTSKAKLAIATWNAETREV